MDIDKSHEKNRGRIEKRTAYVTQDVNWLKEEEGSGWKDLASFGAVHREVEKDDKKTDEWAYYICSKEITAKELQKYARAEWSVETMYWLLDVHFSEDNCRVMDKEVQKTLNIFRKTVINQVKIYKETMQEKAKYTALTAIMLKCLVEPTNLLSVLRAKLPQV